MAGYGVAGPSHSVYNNWASYQGGYNSRGYLHGGVPNPTGYSGMPSGQSGHAPSLYGSSHVMSTSSPPGQMDTSGYLPPFLLGSPAAKSPPRSHGGFSSNQLSTGLSSSLQGMRTTHVPRSTPLLDQSHLDSSKMNGGGVPSKPIGGGPPVHGLHDNQPLGSASLRGTSTPVFEAGSPERRQLNFSNIQTSQRSGAVSTLGSTSRLRANSTPGTVGGSLNTTSLGLKQRTPPSPAQMDPFYTQGENLTSEDDYHDCWVTVFGFPPSSSSYILEQFSQYGTILRHVVSSSGNWMHILYQSRLQAKKALSKNGKVYGNGIMVGVQQCIDKSVMESYSAPFSSDSSSFPDSITHSSATSLTPSKRPPTSIRPLTAAYQASASQHQVAPVNPNTPQKSSGFISKAFEYMFGW